MDLGPRRIIEISSMKMIAFESTGSGGWERNMNFLFKQSKPPRAEKPSSRTYRERDVEHHRALERVRSARARARAKEKAS